MKGKISTSYSRTSSTALKRYNREQLDIMMT